MSGIGMASACGASAMAPPLTCSVTFDNTDVPINVSAASGTLYLDGLGELFFTVDGGTAPYSENRRLLGDPSFKLGFATISGGAHYSIAWSGFAVNESQACYIQYDVTDNVAATASSRYPASGSIIIKRTS